MQNQVFRYFSTFEKCDISRNSGARVAEGPVETLPGRDLMPLLKMSFACQVAVHLMQGKFQRPLQVSDICVARPFMKAFKFNVRENLKREYTKLEL